MTDPHALSTAPTDLVVTFIGDDRPALSAGAYTLTATQPIVDDTGSTLTTLTDSAEFTVHAARFTLEPTDVIAMNPPPTASGRFDTTLPHLVLNSSGLPWARTLTRDTDPWMALLLVTADDVVADSGTGEAIRAGTVRDLLDPPAHVLAPALDRQALADRLTLPCRTVDLRFDVLEELLPKRSELRWLVHVRDVTRAARFGAAVVVDDFDPGRHAVLAANRFPRIGPCRYTAVLVSLEGHTGFTFLGGTTAPPRDTAAVRMTALWSWSFDSTAPGDAGHDFQTLADELAEASRVDNRLRLPRGSTTGHVADRLAAGYVPVAYQLPTGEHTPAWYRGPCTALPPQPLPTGREPLTGPDAALIWIEDQGVWDVGYACAYALGQVLAAADPTLLRTLESYRAHGLATLRRGAAARGAGSRAGGDSAADDDEPDTARLRFQRLVEGGLAPEIDEGLKKRPTATAAPRRTAADNHTRRRGAEQLALLVAELIADAKADAGGESDPADTRRDPATPRAAALRRVADKHAIHLAQALGPAEQWLVRVPFDHLVPHAGMLPERTTRFFHIDPAWMHALFAGIRCTGATTSLDVHLDRILHQALTEAGEPELPVFGAFVRSPLVRYWPDLIIEATDAGDTPLSTRAGRPLADVALLLWDTLPASVTLREPPHGLSLGIDTTNHGGSLNLRVPDGADLGKPLFREATGIDACLRGTAGSSPRAREVLRVAEGNPCLRDLLQAALDGAPALTPAGLALQLLNPAGELVFVPKP